MDTSLPSGIIMRRVQLLARLIATVITAWIMFRLGSAMSAPGAGTQPSTQPVLPPAVTNEMTSLITEGLLAAFAYVFDFVMHMKQDEQKTAAPAGLLFPEQKLPPPPPPPSATPDVTLDPGEPFRFPGLKR